MSHKKSHVHLSDLAGISRLTVVATRGIVDLAEALHNNIASSPGIAGNPVQGHIRAISKLVYESVRGVTGLVGETTDDVLAQFKPILNEPSSPKREAVLAALNGVVGDYLAASNNPLAITMRLRRNGHPLPLERRALAAALSTRSAARVARTPVAHDKLLVMVHGLCMNDLQWTQKGRALESAVTRDLGYTTIHLHYNSGLHVSTNGRAFADLLEELLAQWPEALKEFGILAHSMGGLVARSAFHYGMEAGHAWPRRLQKMIFLGTPHHGAPLERVGNLFNVCLGVSPYTAPFAKLGQIRSAGITDLRYGNVLDEDWQGRDRFEHAGDLRHPLPLPDGVLSYAIAANTGKKLAGIVGDGIVPVASALGKHEDAEKTLLFAPSRQWVGHGMNHWGLLSRKEVHEKILNWMGNSKARTRAQSAPK
jgi:pimeloyl-ACP methyl ester carboxylesterase